MPHHVKQRIRRSVKQKFLNACRVSTSNHFVIPEQLKSNHEVLLLGLIETAKVNNLHLVKILSQHLCEKFIQKFCFQFQWPLQIISVVLDQLPPKTVDKIFDHAVMQKHYSHMIPLFVNRPVTIHEHHFSCMMSQNNMETLKILVNMFKPTQHWIINKICRAKAYPNKLCFCSFLQQHPGQHVNSHLLSHMKIHNDISTVRTWPYPPTYDVFLTTVGDMWHINQYSFNIALIENFGMTFRNKKDIDSWIYQVCLQDSIHASQMLSFLLNYYSVPVEQSHISNCITWNYYSRQCEVRYFPIRTFLDFGAQPEWVNTGVMLKLNKPRHVKQNCIEKCLFRIIDPRAVKCVISCFVGYQLNQTDTTDGDPLMRRSSIFSL